MDALGPILLAFTAAGAWAAGVSRRRATRVRRAVEQADIALRERRWDDAERVLLAALKSARENDYRVALLTRLGTATMMRGALGEAIAHLEQARSCAPARSLGSVLVPYATAQAYAGDLSAARATLEQARAHLPVSYTRTGLVFIEATIALRSGEPERAATLLENAVPELEARTTESQMKGIHLLIAFARSNGDPRHAADVDRHLALARSDDPHRYAAYTVSWPEMRAFCESRGLSGS